LWTTKSKSKWEHEILKAEISLCYKSMREAEAVFQAVSPDNIKVPRGLLIETTREGTKVSTKIECRTELMTFAATIDDLMSAVSVAERSISAAKKH